MKTKFLACSILLALLAGSSLALLNNKKVVNETEAYSTSSLPTTIDLNDTSAADIRSYYSSLNSLTANERKGTNLLKNLKTILKNEQKYYSYDSGNGIWQLYEITDRDWVKSPASSTVYGTYDSVNNKLIDYTYGTSNSNGKNNPYIHALYINRNVDNQTLAWGNHNQDEWGINREHVWPKSLGFEDVGDGGARGDPMHLMAGNGYSNNIHSNYFYGYVDTDSSYTDCGTKYSNQYGNLRGTSLTKGSGMVFEPQDCDKGDIARAIFYMVARYNYLSGSDSDGIDSNNPNLTLVQESTCNETYVSTTTYPGRMGVLTDLLAWHHADPVDEFEIHRNNLLYTNYTNNRNPFIDFPEWVDYIWGTASYSGNQYQSYDSTPTGTANPSSDTINGYNSYSGTVVSISVSDQNTTFTVGDAFSFGGTVTAHYDNSTTKDVTSEATFTGYDMSTAGNQTVTVTYSGKTTTYQITVNEPSGNEPIDAEMSNGSYCYTSTVNGRPAIKMGTASTAGNMRVTVGEGATSLSFYAAAWKGETNNTINITGATVNPSSVSITADSGISGSSSDYTLYASESVFLHEIALSNITSTTTLTLSVGGDGKRAVVWSPKYTCVNKEVTSISATPNKTFYVGETITKSDILVIDNNNAPITDFNFTSYQFTYEDAQSGGALTNKTFTNAITHETFTCSLTVQVQRKNYGAIDDNIVTYLAADFSSISTSYQTGQTLTLQGTTFNVDGYYYYNGSKLSFSNGKTSAPGSLQNTTPYSSGITDVSISGATPDIQLSTNGSNWVDLDSANTSTNNYYYFKAFYKNTTQTNYTNIESITVSTKGFETAKNVSNYIMYEDTNNQCLSKLDPTIIKLNNMPVSEKTTFWNSDDYVISHARTRLQAWAHNQGKVLNYVDGEYILQTLNGNLINQITTENRTIIILSLVTATGIVAGSIILYLKKRKKVIK